MKYKFKGGPLDGKVMTDTKRRVDYEVFEVPYVLGFEKLKARYSVQPKEPGDFTAGRTCIPDLEVS